MARVRRPLPIFAATGIVLRRHLLCGAGATSARMARTRQPAGTSRLQFRRLPPGSRADADVRQERENRFTRWHELSVAGTAGFGNHDATVAASNKGIGDGRSDRGWRKAIKVTQ